MSKDLNKEIMKKSRLQSNFQENKAEINRKNLQKLKNSSPQNYSK